ncbi:MAG: ester cyclase [Thermomicrobiales bacterium]
MNRRDAENAETQQREANIGIVRRYFDAANAGDLDALDDLLAPDVIDHAAYAGQPAGRDGFKAFIAMWRAAFPDLVYTIEDEIANGDRVVVRWTGQGTHLGMYHHIAPTGKRVTMSGIQINRLAGGKIVEDWTSTDELGLLRQLGAIPE